MTQRCIVKSFQTWNYENFEKVIDRDCVTSQFSEIKKVNRGWSAINEILKLFYLSFITAS